MKKIYLLIAIAFININIFSQTCTNWAVTPNTQNNVPSSGGNYSAQVTATGSCTYNTTMNDSWLHFVSYGSNGLFNYSVDANTCEPRTGTISINDVTDGINDIVTLTVNQLAGVTSPPSNDEPCNAIPLNVGTFCSFNTYSNCGATPSSSIPTPSCANYQGGDVWFSVVVPSSGHLIFDSNIGSMTDGGMSVYSGSCSSMSEINCDDDASANGLMPYLDLPGLPIGQTIFIRFWGYNGVSGTFQICVYDAGNAPPIPTGLTAAVASCYSINLSWNSSVGATSYDVYTCSGSSVTNTSNTNYTVTGLNPNTYYDYKVRAIGTLGSSSFSLCQGATTLTCGPSNDECSNAETLIPNTNCSFASGTTYNATQSQPIPTSGWCSLTYSTYAYDVWYKFTATCPNHHIQVQGASDFAATVEVEDAACGNSLGCDNTGTGGLVDLSVSCTVGNTYYIRVYNDYAFSMWATGTDFQICVTPSCPDNDDCNFATSLVSGINCNYISGSTIDATQSQQPSVPCPTYYSPYAAYDVWYKFTAVKSNHVIKVLGASDFTPIVVVENAACGSVLWCDGSFVNGSTVTMNLTGLTIGNIYYIRVYDYGTYGHFQICITHSGTGVDDNAYINYFSIYPNPANDKLNVEFEITNSYKQILFTLYNCIGQIVLVEKIDNVQFGKIVKTLDIKSLSSGVYQFQIILYDGTCINRKIVIQK